MDKPVNSVDNIVKTVDNYTCAVDEYSTFCGKIAGSHSLNKKKAVRKLERQAVTNCG